MKRHELLAALHQILAPRTYLEVGVNNGSSLALSRVPSVAIDPAYGITKEIHTEAHLERTSSDEFFARPNPLERLPIPVLDLAFIDGMHLSEFALRDFINVERWTTPASVVVFDDMLPRNVTQAARDRHSKAWTGDVYKVAEALRRWRPDLVVLELDTAPTGTLMVLVPDARNTVLRERYETLVTEMVTPDPQDVPREVLRRTRAVDPEQLLKAPFWEGWSRLRDRTRPVTAADVREWLQLGGIDAFLPRAQRQDATTMTEGSLS
ncbi:MAG TPA: class I SAM-dependent methyltransferase [Segeticoccus sp.]|uniref:class I SAM-dependent methyltransferase n=1 Tax=Segeticoccus sp. TaxID=2706531 RepID=UPI002D7EB8B0|nr:class I SAM-dependent methyltransferase [Segeticoccus sp.]HET8601060.1 class I SAM-dependent methyltransferase [Segeticoccus sp.]